MVEAKPQKAIDPSGVALAVTFFVSGVLCIFAPSFFDASGWQETAWNLSGSIFALFGAAGFAAELTKTKEKTELSDFAVGVVCLLAGLGCALAATAWKLRSPIPGALKATCAVFVFVGLYGCFNGITKAVARYVDSDGTARPGWSARIGAIAVGFVGFATAVVNLYAAFQAVPSRKP